MTNKIRMAWDEIPDWIKQVTYRDEFDVMEPDRVLSQLNYLKGAYQGFTAQVADLKAQLEEADEKFDLARDYQRQLDIQTLQDMVDGVWPQDMTSIYMRQGIQYAIDRLKRG